MSSGRFLSLLRSRRSPLNVPVCSMYNNPYLKRFKEKMEPPPNSVKKTTGLTGLPVTQNPHRSLTVAYGRILRALDAIPADAVYRRHTEALVKQRLQLVQEEEDVQKLEEKIGMGQVEELLEQAEFELQTVRAIIDSRAWEPLVEEAPVGQWKWPIA